MYIQTIQKTYKKSVKILVFNRGVDISPPQCPTHHLISCQTCFPRKVNSVLSPSSIMRTKARISDLVEMNDFELFTTFTFDPNKVDSLNINLAKLKMSKWLNNQKRESPDLKYLIVSELHKSGRIHFHALLSNFNGNLSKALTKTGKQRKKNGRPIWNIGAYNWGYSTAIEIDDIQKVANYMQKYITKDMLTISNKKRYWRSTNLETPAVDYNINLVEMVYSRPLFVTSKFVDEYFTIYRVLR